MYPTKNTRIWRLEQINSQLEALLKHKADLDSTIFVLEKEKEILLRLGDYEVMQDGLKKDCNS